MCYSHDSNLVGDVQSVLIGGENDVCLLEAIRSDKGVDSLDLDVIELLASFLDHGLVGPSVNNEYQCVVIFDSLDGAFSAEWVLYDGILVPCLFLLHTLPFILGFPVKSKGGGSSESDLGPHFVLSLGVDTFLNCSSGGLGSSNLS